MPINDINGFFLVKIDSLIFGFQVIFYWLVYTVVVIESGLLIKLMVFILF